MYFSQENFLIFILEGLTYVAECEISASKCLE